MTEPVRIDWRGNSAECRGCGNEIDPDTCWCGSERRHHDPMNDGHAFVCMGCDCHRSPPIVVDIEPEVPPHEMPEGRFLDALRRLRGGWTI